MVWLQGIAFGVPVVPEEKSILVESEGLQLMKHDDSLSLRNSSQVKSSFLIDIKLSFSETIIALGELAFITFSYRGRVFFPLEMNDCVKMAFASEILRRVEISSGAKLSAIETTTHPALIMPR